jgi:hypothetical protein
MVEGVLGRSASGVLPAIAQAATAAAAAEKSMIADGGRRMKYPASEKLDIRLARFHAAACAGSSPQELGLVGSPKLGDVRGRTRGHLANPG